MCNKKLYQTPPSFSWFFFCVEWYNLLFSITLDFVIPNSSNHCTCQCIFIMYSYVRIIFISACVRFFLSHQARGQCSLPPLKNLHHTTPNLAAAVYQSTHPAVKSEEASFGSLFDFGISLFVASLGGIGSGFECGWYFGSPFISPWLTEWPKVKFRGWNK
jgi:hypothetical protein